MVDLLPGFKDVRVVNREGAQGHVRRCLLAEKCSCREPGFGDTLVERNLGAEADDEFVLGQGDEE
ncbi:hypothetical protein [Paenarthrobacter nicotinovorans]|uniref:hypothetical protein n=1 Tax=Paenarthrobacter nicotinovorans TaxID=29320 RepID=UPI003A7FA1E0